MYDIICYRLKGHLHYQVEVVPAGTPVNDALENIQNVEETMRFTGYSSKEDAQKFIDKFQSGAQ